MQTEENRKAMFFLSQLIKFVPSKCFIWYWIFCYLDTGAVYQTTVGFPDMFCEEILLSPRIPACNWKSRRCHTWTKDHYSRTQSLPRDLGYLEKDIQQLQGESMKQSSLCTALAFQSMSAPFWDKHDSLWRYNIMQLI